MNNKNVVYAQPVCEDHSNQIDDMIKYNAEVDAEKRIANQSIIEIANDLNNSKKANKRNFIITVVISGLTLLFAIASFIISLIK